MSDMLIVWSAIFLVLLAVYSLVLWKSKEKKLYILYFLFGILFGFYFDSISVMQGYYYYPELFINVLGVPITMVLAEGFSVAITIKIFEVAKGFLSGKGIRQ
ncbi:MAG: hypothetical protein FJY76_01130 [Candidatus Aenigmarchaeota archaeon]|nr:hypothetical protein [Candidatus Aenigmarchaeota archaeon]